MAGHMRPLIHPASIGFITYDSASADSYKARFDEYLYPPAEPVYRRVAQAATKKHLATMPVNFDSDLLLVTAASGKQAGFLLSHLVKKWKRLRLQCISDSSKERLQLDYPNAEVVQSDFSTPEKARTLFKGTAACYLVLPAFHPRETQHGLNMIDAATEECQTGGFKHMVFSSVIHSLLRSLANHDDKRFVEEALVESGVPYTTVQPTHLMDNLPVREIVKQQDPVFPARFDPNTKFSFVSCHDIGEAVANILANRETYIYGTYQLVSTPCPLDYKEVIEIVSSVSGRDIRIERKPVEETSHAYAEMMSSPITSKNELRTIERNFARMLVYYNSKGLIGNPRALEMILGRTSLGYREWVELQLLQQACTSDSSFTY